MPRRCKIYLNKQGIEVGTGSACSSGSVHPSHVLIAMGKSEKEAFQSLRITFGEKTKKNRLSTSSHNYEAFLIFFHRKVWEFGENCDLWASFCGARRCTKVQLTVLPRFDAPHLINFNQT